MSLDLSSLHQGVAALRRALGVARRISSAEDVDKAEWEVVRAGVIQHFEFTYELCWKYMRRWLADNLGRTYVDGISRKELFRLAAQQRLIDGVERWITFHYARSRTSHTYDATVAAEVYRTAGDFLDDAQTLVSALSARND